MGIELLTLDVGNPSNLGLIVRTAYILGGSHCKLHLFDPRTIFSTYEKQIEECSVGLSASSPPQVVTDLQKFLSHYSGRIIAADATEDAVPLHDLKFEEGDLILFGNENTGYLNKDLKA